MVTHQHTNVLGQSHGLSVTEALRRGEKPQAGVQREVEQTKHLAIRKQW